MNTNRRQARTIPDKLAFIQMDQDDGGRVLNISEEGLGFEVFAPLHQKGPIRFWFSLDLSDRIEAVGEVAWTNTTGRAGGLRFLELSPDARGQIQSWIKQNSDHNGIEPGNSGSEVVVTPDLPNTTQLVPLERYRSATRQQLIRGVLLGILVTSAVAIPVARYSNSRKQTAALPPAPGQTTVAIAEGGETAPASASVASRNSVASVPEKAQRLASAGPQLDNPQGSSITKHRLQSLGSSTGSAEVHSVAEPQPREIRSARKSVASPQQLWAAVQGGSAQAAVTLADLYLRGVGVPANCDQARVLLLVASEKRNPQAIRELRELDKTGCPVPGQ